MFKRDRTYRRTGGYSFYAHATMLCVSMYILCILSCSSIVGHYQVQLLQHGIQTLPK